MPIIAVTSVEVEGDVMSYVINCECGATVKAENEDRQDQMVEIRRASAPRDREPVEIEAENQNGDDG